MDALNYCKEHPELNKEECAFDLGISVSTLRRWEKRFGSTEEDIPSRGSGNYSSDAKKKIAILENQLRNAQDAIEILKGAIANLEKDDRSHLY